MATVWAELKRRNVVRVAVFYIVASWLVLQVAELLFEILDLSPDLLRAVLALLVLGFPVALVVSWIYELTPEGLTRESDVDRSQARSSMTSKRLDIATMVLVAIGISIVLADRFYLQTTKPSAPYAASMGVAPRDAGTPIVAVLPFKATGSEDGGFLAGGLHSDLLTRLAKLEAFKVTSRTSVMEYADTTKNMRQIGAELGARYILEGGVQAFGSRVRVNAKLINTGSDETIWAQTYDEKLTAEHLFDIQAALAKAIAGEMKSSLSESDSKLIDQIPTQSIEAYNAYLQGMAQRDRGGMGPLNTVRTLAFFEEAVRFDPDFALAWAQLSIERSRNAQGTEDPQKEQAALAALEKARLLQPDLKEVALAEVVFLYRVQFDYAPALEALQVLAERHELDTSDMMLKAYLLRRLGRWEEAYRSAVSAHKLDPRSISTTANLVTLAWEAGHCKEAGAYAKAGLSLDPVSVVMLTQISRYELQCNGNARRANDLLQNAAFTNWLQNVAAIDAAKAARDYPRLLQLASHSIPLSNPGQQFLDSLVRVQALRYLEQHGAAEAELAAIGERMLSQQGPATDSWIYSAAISDYYMLQGDTGLMNAWQEETQRRFDQQFKGDLSMQAYSIRKRAENFAYAGLHEQALEELQEMVITPGAARMPFVDALPEFDGLRNHPEYIALLEQYGTKTTQSDPHQ